MINNKNHNKMLSHRVRGFSKYEQSPSAFQKACMSSICYLEVDTRVSKDGEIFVNHNPHTGKSFTRNVVFSKTLASEIKQIKFKNGEKILDLENCLSIFKNRKNVDQILCIDIKDYGFEEEHLSLVKKYNLERNIIFISWIPQILIKLQNLDANIPLILSHWNFYEYKVVGKLIGKLIKNKKIRIFRHILMDKNLYNSDLVDFEHGYQHTIVFQNLPNEILKLLSFSKGGICIHKSMFGKNIAEYCRKNDLKRWVFSVSTKKEFYKYANNPGIDVVFCDVVFNQK